MQALIPPARTGVPPLVSLSSPRGDPRHIGPSRCFLEWSVILPILQVVRGPFLVEGTVARVVELNDGSGRVEVWEATEKGWVAGGDWSEAAAAPPAAPDVLTGLGIPPEEW